MPAAHSGSLSRTSPAVDFTRTAQSCAYSDYLHIRNYGCSRHASFRDTKYRNSRLRQTGHSIQRNLFRNQRNRQYYHGTDCHIHLYRHAGTAAPSGHPHHSMLNTAPRDTHALRPVMGPAAIIPLPAQHTSTQTVHTLRCDPPHRERTRNSGNITAALKKYNTIRPGVAHECNPRSHIRPKP